MKRKRIEWLGLLGPVSLLSYSAAVLFAPMAYPGYDWMSQAVSDLSAAAAPSSMLWSQLSGFYGVSGVVSITLAAIYIEDKLTLPIRSGIYLFALMTWISYLGYTLFPLTESGRPITLQDMLHVFLITPLVVILSIASLTLIILGGFKAVKYKTLAYWAAIALFFMLAGALGTAVVPAEYFGIPERFSAFSAVGFNAVLGICLFRGFNFKNKGV